MNITHECHIYTAENFHGELIECDELRPAWFDEEQIPYSIMWQDYKFWLPKLMRNQMFKAYFLFKEDKENIEHFSLEDIQYF